MPLAPLIPTGEWSRVVFHLPNVAMAVATRISKLHLNVRKPARSVNIVPALVENSLLSTNKFVEAGYTAIYDAKEVNFYDARTTKIVVSEAAILRGWRCPRAKLWRIPIIEVVTNKNMDTLLLDHPHGHDSINAMYQVETSTAMCDHIQYMDRITSKEHIHNVYELPSVEPSIQYLHGAAGFPIKTIMAKSHPQGKLQFMAINQHQECSKVFPRVGKNAKGSHARPTPGSTVNEEIGINTGQRQ
jgi:hypothetical protein